MIANQRWFSTRENRPCAFDRLMLKGLCWGGEGGVLCEDWQARSRSRCALELQRWCTSARQQQSSLCLKSLSKSSCWLLRAVSLVTDAISSVLAATQHTGNTHPGAHSQSTHPATHTHTQTHREHTPRRTLSEHAPRHTNSLTTSLANYKACR